MPDPIVRTQEEVRQSQVGLNTCAICRREIHMMCRKYTGICSENCQKKHAARKDGRDPDFAIAA